MKPKRRLRVKGQPIPELPKSSNDLGIPKLNPNYVSIMLERRAARENFFSGDEEQILRELENALLVFISSTRIHNGQPVISTASLIDLLTVGTRYLNYGKGDTSGTDTPQIAPTLLVPDEGYVMTQTGRIAMAIEEGLREISDSVINQRVDDEAPSFSSIVHRTATARPLFLDSIPRYMLNEVRNDRPPAPSHYVGRTANFSFDIVHNSDGSTTVTIVFTNIDFYNQTVNALSPPRSFIALRGDCSCPYSSIVGRNAPTWVVDGNCPVHGSLVRGLW